MALENECQEHIYMKELDMILRFGALINSSLHIEDVLNYAMKWAEDFMDASASTIYELDDEKEEIFVRLARGEKNEPVKGIRLKMGEGIAGKVVQAGKPMVVQSVKNEKHFSDKYDRMTGFKTQSMICVPLILRDKPVGALQVLNKKDDTAFTQFDLDLLTGMSHQVAVAIENAKLFQRLEKRFELTAQELKKTQEKLIRSERLSAMGHLVRGVAHEIRNPIMTIGGFANRAKAHEKDDEKLIKYMDIILQETGRLEKLVRDVHDFSEFQSASLSLNRLEPVLVDILNQIEPELANRGIVLGRQIERDLPPVKMDPYQLSRALHNILENAMEAMPNGGRMELKTALLDQTVQITISDTGCGIEPEELDAVYDPFVTSKTRGAGLGLTMVHQIVLNHDGEIKIRSKKGKGTVVTIDLPVPANFKIEESR